MRDTTVSNIPFLREIHAHKMIACRKQLRVECLASSYSPSPPQTAKSLLASPAPPKMKFANRLGVNHTAGLPCHEDSRRSMLESAAHTVPVRSNSSMCVELRPLLSKAPLSLHGGAPWSWSSHVVVEGSGKAFRENPSPCRESETTVEVCLLSNGAGPLASCPRFKCSECGVSWRIGTCRVLQQRRSPSALAGELFCPMNQPRRQHVVLLVFGTRLMYLAGILALFESHPQ